MPTHSITPSAEYEGDASIIATFDAVVSKAENTLRETFEQIHPAPASSIDWSAFTALGDKLIRIYRPDIAVHRITVRHPKEYNFQLAYADNGLVDAKYTIVCLGGIVNTAHRFDLLSTVLATHGVRVIAVDWPGRGFSGWLQEMEDYTLENEVDHIHELLESLDLQNVIMLGSSRGAMVTLRLTARKTERIRAVILNDTGPILPIARRKKRAGVLGRHFVFNEPSSLFYRLGAMQKNDGPTPESYRFHLSNVQTRFAENEGGRTYWHDLRPLLQYRVESQFGVEFCTEWAGLDCPALIVRGEESDVLTDQVMQVATELAPKQTGWLTVGKTGHTPTFAGGKIISAALDFIQNPENWLQKHHSLLEKDQPAWLFRGFNNPKSK